MSEPTDQHLLSAWAGRRDEAAFRSLLGRYAGFVYGAALRRVSDPGLAEEVAQDVFVRLSLHSGRLVKHPSLAGWLHRATMLLGLDRLRRRTRHERKIEHFSVMNVPTLERDPWADVGPYLDEALDCLGARERDVLMLHFAERLTFREIAERLGSTTDAARMRASRALAVLSSLLRKKGVVVPLAILSSGLAGVLAHTAPAALATLAPAALAGTGKVGALSMVIHSMHTMKSAKVTVTAALALFLFVPLVLQQREISAAEARLDSRRNVPADLVATIAADAKTLPVTAGVPRTRRGFDLKKLGEDALDGGPFAVRRIRAAVAPLDNNNLAGLIETVMKGGLLPEPRDKLLLELLELLHHRDLPLCVEWCLKVFCATVPSAAANADSGDVLREHFETAFREWAGREPARAQEWAAAHEDEWRRLHGTSLNTLAVSGLITSDLPRACALMESLPAQACLDAMRHALSNVDDQPFMPLAVWAASLSDADKRRRLVEQAIWLKGEYLPARKGLLEMASSMLAGISLSGEDLSWVATNLALIGGSDLSALRNEKFPWIERIIPPDRVNYAKGTILGRLSDTREAFAFITEELARSHDDEWVAGYVETHDAKWHLRGWSRLGESSYHGDVGFRLAVQVRDPERRLDLLTKAWKELDFESRDAARAILEIPELKPTDRAALEARLQSPPKKSR